MINNGNGPVNEDGKNGDDTISYLIFKTKHEIETSGMMTIAMGKIINNGNGPVMKMAKISNSPALISKNKHAIECKNLWDDDRLGSAF